MGSTQSKWLNYKMPDAEYVDPAILTRDRSTVGASKPIAWPELFVDMFTKRRDPSQVSDDGFGSGTPMQLGTTSLKTLKVGVFGRDPIVKVKVPKPKLGFWWTTGYPTPRADRHATIVAPNGDVFEFIQLEASSSLQAIISGLFFATHANGYGIWRNGELIEGRATTAPKLPRYRYLWTPFSAADPHVGSIVLPDYVGADGLLDEGPVAGSRVVLDPRSASYTSMIAMGGECQALAEAGATHGWVVIDRNGYADVHADRRAYDIGKVPHEPTIEMQPGGQWRGTNVRDFTIRLGDLREAV